MNRIPVYCAGCRERLDYTADTNGDGEVLLYVRGCLRCTGLVRQLRHRITPRKRQPPQRIADPTARGGALAPKPKRNAAGDLVCIHCDAVLGWTPRRVRPPAYCAQHRDPKNRTT